MSTQQSNSQQKTANIQRDDKGNVTVRPFGVQTNSDASLKRQSDNGQTSQER
jgi:hypothetical protein